MERFRRLRSSLSYANVMATLAVFVALGGSGYAAVEITGRDVRNNSLSGADIRNNSLTGADIRNKSLTGADIRNNSLTSADIRNGSLLAKDFKKGQLPTAVPAGATSWTVHRELGDGDTQQLPAIPGLVQPQISCSGPDSFGGAGNSTLNIQDMTTGGTDTVISYQTTSTPQGAFVPSHNSMSAGEQFGFVFTPGVTQFTLQLAPNTPDQGPVATVTGSWVDTAGAPCDFIASASWQNPVAG
jgi:hypothetical protein